MTTKPKKGATHSKLQREVANGYAAWCIRRGLKPPGKWSKRKVGK